MTRPTVVLRRAVVLALGATLLLALPASAHPYVQGGEAPVDSLASLVLHIGHGCAIDEGGHSHGEGPEEPTTEVALEVHEQMRIVDVPEVDGFDIALETDEDGNVEVVVWTATTSTEPAPELPFDAVFSGEPGDELYLRVFQGCEELSSRWVGTPDEPADEPAVQLLLVDADPDRPPPPEEEPADQDVGREDDAGAEASQAEESTAGEDGVEEPVADDADGEDPEAEDGAGAETTPATVPDAPENSPLLWGIVALVGAALLLAVILSMRRRPVAAVSPRAIEGDDVDDPPASDPTLVDPTLVDPTPVDPTPVDPKPGSDPTTADAGGRADHDTRADRDTGDHLADPDPGDHRDDQDPR